MTVIILALVLLLVVVSAASLLAMYLLGFRLGGQSWITECHRIRAEAARAERQLHELTRTAFVAMAEEAHRHRQEQ